MSGLLGLASFAHAEVAYIERIISDNLELGTPIGGVSVSMDGEWAAVGAYDLTNTDSCFITVFRHDYNSSKWVEFQTLGDNAGNCNANKGFGSAITISGTEMVVGLANYAENGGAQNNGGAFSAYAFDGTEWVLVFDRIRPLKTNGDDDIQKLGGFGLSVNIQDGILVVGAPKYDSDTVGEDTGKVYIYEKPDPFPDPVDLPIESLTPTVTVEGNQSGSFFGASVAGDREDILVGAPYYDTNYTDAGAGYIYEYNGTSITLSAAPVYGTSTNENLGLHLEHDHDLTHDNLFAVISGNLSSHGYHYTVDEGWHIQYTENNTSGGDVDINTNLGAIATKGTSVKVFPLFLSSLENYYVDVTPLNGNVSSEYAEDISLDWNHVAVSDFGNKQVRFYEMPCGYGGELVEYEWTMASIPCKISGQTVDTIFGDDGLGTYGTNWVVWEQNTSNYSGESADYIKLNENSPIEQGKSYWIIADANRTWKVDSAASISHTEINTTIVTPTDVIAGVYAIPLPRADQNVSGDVFAKVMLGNPFARSFEWTNVQYYSVSDANRTLTNANTKGYMNSTAYIYDSSITSGQPYTAVTSTPGVGTTTIPVNQGFWIKMLEDAATGDKLLIPLEK